MNDGRRERVPQQDPMEKQVHPLVAAERKIWQQQQSDHFREMFARYK